MENFIFRFPTLYLNNGYTNPSVFSKRNANENERIFVGPYLTAGSDAAKLVTTDLSVVYILSVNICARIISLLCRSYLL